MPRLKKLPVLPPSHKVVSILALCAKETDHEQLRMIFGRTNWSFTGVCCCKEALDKLNGNAINIVICDSRLPDGNWKDFLRNIRDLPDSPLLIVTSKDDDVNLWAEVLNLGGYDMLLKPFVKEEVVRVVSLAWLHWREGSGQPKRKAAKMDFPLRRAPGA